MLCVTTVSLTVSQHSVSVSIFPVLSLRAQLSSRQPGETTDWGPHSQLGCKLVAAVGGLTARPPRLPRGLVRGGKGGGEGREGTTGGAARLHRNNYEVSYC